MEDYKLNDSELTLLNILLGDHVKKLGERESDATDACTALDNRIQRVLRELPHGSDHSVVSAMFDAERSARSDAYVDANREWGDAVELLRRVSAAASISLSMQVQEPVATVKRRARR